MRCTASETLLRSGSHLCPEGKVSARNKNIDGGQLLAYARNMAAAPDNYNLSAQLNGREGAPILYISPWGQSNQGT
jgi:hypothetical protein